MGARSVIVTGSTGYMGVRLTRVLLEQGHRVCCVARPKSVRRLPAGCVLALGDVLDGESYREHVRPGDTFVHLAGVAHPSPAKARQFEEIDYRSAVEAIRVAKLAGAAHFIYVSVAHPSPVMKDYIDVRMRCEQHLLGSAIPVTILRPFYVLGPGHYWPYALKPLYWIGERVGPFREGAKRLGLVTIRQMVDALAFAVENPPRVCAFLDVPRIRTLLPSSSRRAAA